MNEQLQNLGGLNVSRETLEKLEQFAGLLREEAVHQNLISAATMDHLWERHIVDSAQLVPFDTREGAKWIDVGSGAGLPGIVLSAFLPGRVTLVEPRRLRAEFLLRITSQLALDAVVVCAKAERVGGRYDVITARAVAPLDRLLGLTHHLSHEGTIWVLPKGRNAKSELEEAKRSWHYELRAEPSVTDPDSRILVLSNVRAKSRK